MNSYVSCIAAAAIAVTTLSGCSGNLNNAAIGQGAGMATGAVVGGIIGERVGGRGGMIAGMILGTAIGGMVGYEIGHSLDVNERAALNRRMALGMSSAKDNEPFRWASPKGNAAAQISVDKKRTETRKVAILRPTIIEPTPALDVIGEPYVARMDATVHSGPRAGGASVAKLKKGQTVVAMGRVRNSSWIAVGKDGQMLGYVTEKSVVAQSEAEAANFERTMIAKPAGDNNAAQVQTAAATGLMVDQVDASTSCRLVSYNIIKDGNEAEKRQIDACKTADGNWTYQG